MNERQEILNSYGGVCPDCGKEIPPDVCDGEGCSNCGHVFCLPRPDDDAGDDDTPDILADGLDLYDRWG